jgi:hypothetical protein
MILPVCAAAWFTGTAFLFNSPTVGTGFDRLTGVPNLSMLMVFTTVVAMLGSMRIMFLMWRNPPARVWLTIRGPVLAYGMIVVTIIVLFFVGAPAEERHMDFIAAFQREPYLAGMLILYFTSVAYGLADAAILYLNWTKTTPSDQMWLRVGLRMSAFAFIFPVGYGIINLVAIIGSWFGYVHDDLSTVIAPNVAGAGVPIVVAGLSIAAWGPRLAAVWARAIRYLADLRDYRRLRPLWKALTTIDPAMIHQPSSLRERVSLRPRLFWRVIEINDWLHQLRGYRDPAIATNVARRGYDLGLTAADIEAAAEAAQIIAAVVARAKGQKVTAGGTAADQQEAPGETLHAFGAERARLVMTARMLRNPLVAGMVSSAGTNRQ